MLIIDSFGKDIIVGDVRVGYVGENELYMGKRKFADITDDGIISFEGEEIGYIEDDLSIIIRDNEVGYIDDRNNFVFYKRIM